VPFVYDQHDLCPELYESRFPDGPGLPHRILLALERATYRTARHVISTNESYRRAAMRRGGKHLADITIVRTGPDPDRLRRGDAVSEHLREGRFLAVYIGVMGPQDGVDYAIRAAAHVKHELCRHDIMFTFIGSGDSFEELKLLAHDLDVDDIVHFTGRAPDSLVAELMSTAHVGLSPDPKNALNDVSTMNKTMEYMAYELPVVAFDLVETRVSAQDAAVYVRPNDVAAYGEAIVELVDDPERRARLAKLGRERVESTLAWKHQAASYVSVYERLLGEPGAATRQPVGHDEPAAVGAGASGPARGADPHRKG
jgi:glycosyltransferase involved in cell wall biosynthesis